MLLSMPTVCHPFVWNSLRSENRHSDFLTIYDNPTEVLSWAAHDFAMGCIRLSVMVVLTTHELPRPLPVDASKCPSAAFQLLQCTKHAATLGSAYLRCHHVAIDW